MRLCNLKLLGELRSLLWLLLCTGVHCAWTQALAAQKIGSRITRLLEALQSILASLILGLHRPMQHSRPLESLCTKPVLCRLAKGQAETFQGA